MLKVLLVLFSIFMAASPLLEAADDEEVPVNTSAYVSLGDSMVLNLSNGSRRLTFLQLKADVLVADPDAEDLVKTHIPAIRHQLIVLLSEQKASEMKSPVKREEIRKIATARVQQVMLELADSRDVTEVLFSSFLVQ